MGVLKIWDGTTWQTSSASSDGASVFVGPDAPPGTPGTGDLWYDTDQTSQLVLPLTVSNGGTSAANASAARTNLAVPAIGQSGSTAGAPTTGTWARGDQWLDSANAVWTCTVAGTPGTWMPPIGYEYAYAQITTGTINITATTEATAEAVATAPAVVLDGATPVLVEFFARSVAAPPTAGQSIRLWLYQDGVSLGDLGIIRAPAAANMEIPVRIARRMIPTSGSHTYAIRASVASGTGAIIVGAGGTGAFMPGYIRITRA